MLKKLIQRDLLRAFNAFTQTILATKENRLKVCRVLKMMQVTR